MTTSHRELRELAARAAAEVSHGWESSESWDPVAYDVDAFRLAVALRLHIGLESHAVSVWSTTDRRAWASVPIHEGDDPNAATRLAIARCAAMLEGWKP